MAYQTGTATDRADLLDKLRVFLLANGWTIEAWRFRVAQATARWLAVSKSGVFLNFAETNTIPGAVTHMLTTAHLNCRWSTSYAAGSDFQAQPGGAGNGPGTSDTCVGDLPGPFASYHFFDGVGASGPYVYVAVEVSAGEFRHFGGGILEKVGTYTGGEFTFGHYWSAVLGTLNDPTNGINGVPFDSSNGSSQNAQVAMASVRCVESVGGGEILAYANSTNRGMRCGGWVRANTQPSAGDAAGSPLLAIYQAGPIPEIGLAPLIRVPCYAERPSGFFSLIGEPPAFRHIRVDFLNPGDEITLGTEVWKTFPVVRKGTAPGNRGSGNFGIAYRRTP